MYIAFRFIIEEITFYTTFLYTKLQEPLNIVVLVIHEEYLRE